LVATIDKLLVLKIAAVPGCGLIAGVFLAFSVFVMKALARVASLPVHRRHAAR
jgi:uncharacterized membrane protein